MRGSVPQSPFSTILNLRDVGQTVNLLLGLPLLQEGRLFRSARPDDGTPSEKDSLKNTYQIKHIVDLRSKSEHIAQAKKHSTVSSPSSSSLAPHPPASTTVPLEIPGIEYHLINLNGPAFERALLWKLSWRNMARLAYLMTIGQRIPAISILGTHVMAPRGLLGLACDTLAHSTSELSSLLLLLAQPSNYPALVHCTQGKDRTGLLVILTLILCNVPLKAIDQDYLASEAELLPEKAERMKEITAIGLGEEFAGCQAGFVEGVSKFLHDRWGGVEGYADSIGVGEAAREKIRSNLMAGSR